jgi:O-antigen ligase
MISIFSSVDPYLSGYNVLRVILLTLLFFYVLNEIQSLALVIVPVALMVFIQSTIGISQALNQSSLGLHILGEIELNPEWSGISVVTNEGLRYLRAYGLTDHPNILGGCLALGLILIIGGPSINNKKIAPFYYGVFILGIIALFSTFSRSAWLAFSIAIVFIITIAALKKNFSALTSTTNLIIASVLVLTPFLLAYIDLLGIRFNYRNSFERIPQEQQSIGERILLNQEGNKLFSSSPITGIGLSAFPIALANRNPEFRVDYQPAHFVLIDVAAETGIFGGLFFAILITGPWFVLWINRRRINFSLELILVSGLLLVITIIGFFDYYPWLLAPGRIWQWIAWGLWGATYLSSKK